MKAKNYAKKWIAFFLAGTIFVLAIMSGITYRIDPYFQYRIKDNTYFLTASFVNPGIIKNYDYDTLIIGSCMVGNFDMERFRQDLGMNAVKIESGGMGKEATLQYLNYANKVGRAQSYFINIDIASFHDVGPDAKEYLMKDDIISRMKYFLGYETWFRFIPVDVGLMVYKAWKGEFPPGKFSQRTSIDRNGEWSTDVQFGEEIALSNHETGLFGIPEVNSDELYATMIEQIDGFLSQIEFSNAEYNFIFPPYSILLWCDAQDKGYYDAYINAKKYMIRQLLDKGCTVYDFQSADLILDLNNYMDASHYSSDVNNWMTDCFVQGQYIVTEDNCDILQEQLTEMMEEYYQQHQKLFNK